MDSFLSTSEHTLFNEVVKRMENFKFEEEKQIEGDIKIYKM
jgi:hypothetical protein